MTGSPDGSAPLRAAVRRSAPTARDAAAAGCRGGHARHPTKGPGWKPTPTDHLEATPV
ncbi:hypothetical protein [Kitasatospora sp. NPDC001175]|uniref:hypothetical protein n=1 Tax=Kitasatospora sp. NPDC001175 TaxID=3157103 RepID=UPI003CFBC557